MKTIRKSVLLLLLTIGMIGAAPQKATAQVSVSFQLFYDDLSPYGYWIDNPNYGYVWVPNVSGGFMPYRTNGYWVYTEVGWTWVSNYSWGWAPFHYGRWFYDPYYGWVWVPDTQWGPAWVTWRYCDGYYGWSAIGPGISLEVAFSSGYAIPNNHWVFVRERDFGRRNISNYYVNNSNNITIINKSRVVNNIQTDHATQVRYNAGPDRGIVQQKSKTSIRQVNLKDRGRPGQSMAGNELQLYKPRVERDRNDGKRPAPAKVTGQHDVAPIAERKGIVRQRENKELKIQQQKKPEMQTLPREEHRKELELQRRQKEAVRQQENKELKIQQQKKPEMQTLPREEHRKELELQRRGKEAVRQQNDVNKQRNEVPMPLKHNIPQTQRQQLPLEPGSTTEQLPILKR